MKKQKMVMAASALFMLTAMVFMVVNVAAAISHTVNIGSSVSFQAVGKVNATVTMSHTSENAITLQKNSEAAVTSSTLTIGANDSATTGNFALGDLELTAEDGATGNVTYSYTIEITNNYTASDAATYKFLQVTFTPPTTNSCVTVNYDEDFTWTDGTDTKIVTIDPNTTATIQVVFTTDVSVSNTADMSCSFVLENASIIEKIEYWDGTTSSEPAGTGTEEDPYLISNGAELKWVSDNVAYSSGKYYTQTKDIYLNDGEVIDAEGNLNSGSWKPWTPIGTSSSNKFQGTYDGGGFEVSGIYINNASTNQGLFGRTGSGSTIQNVNVVNSYIKGGQYVGGVCGYNDSGTITNCYNTGTVSGDSSVGGVCGYSSGPITNCYNTGTVSGSSNYVSGVCGDNYSTIENCYNTGTVSGTQYVGGVCGGSAGTIKNCYNTGTVSGSSYVGGVYGYKNSFATIENCYYLSGTASYGIGNTTSDTEDQTSSFSNANNDMTVAKGTYAGNTLLNALNAWVTANTTGETSYKSWTLDGSSHGFPIFEN